MERRQLSAPANDVSARASELTDRNVHVKEYLRYYLSLSTPPMFAVLLDGPWGIGKTFVVKNFLDTLDKEQTPYIYVSLYGIRSVDEIDDAILRSMYPVLKSRSVAIGGRALKTIGKYFNVELDLKAKDFLSKSRANVYVFDDLERSEMPINTVMGYINVFVEQEGCKVIIVANENEIKDEDYRRVREKVVGKTFEVQSALEEALGGFVAMVKEEAARKLISSCIPVISEVYHQSELNNLRVLQQTIWDFERLHAILDDKHRMNEAAMTTLLAVLFALSFEVKAGRLSAGEFKDRRTLLLTALMNSQKENYVAPRIVAANLRYPLAQLGADLLSDETLVDLIIRGIVDKEVIRGELDESSFFLTVEQEPAWRTVWNSHERTEDQFNHALAEMMRLYASHKYTIPGEIQHVFGLQLRLADIGVIAINRQQVLANAKAYVDHLYDHGALEPLDPRRPDFDLEFNSYGGLGFYEAASADTKKFYDYMNGRRGAAFNDLQPALAEDLIKNLKTDVRLFLRRICQTNHEENEFFDIPILASLDVPRFVAAFLELHPATQRTAMLALKMRYERGRLDGDLKDERPWATAVREQILAASEAMSPISKDRLQRLVAYGLDGALGLAEAS
ncbi:P-loop NTPase fold protein [Stenotrophomonas indicatrix]|uniref:P-loop NTPase fold protein n=1 Tax=Stenotrophomonas indicatrix TaxID=2045451 RepID=UPI002FDA6BE2